MSSQKGNVSKKGPPKYQNREGFRHNPKSRLTAILLALPNQGLCGHCHEKVEWKKKYRKYKRLTTRHRCTGCQEKNITHAYHTLCQGCARSRNVCAWCQKQGEIVVPTKTKEEIKAEADAEETLLLTLSLRQKRSYFREKERRRALEEGLSEPAPGSHDDDDSEEDVEEEEDGEKKKVSKGPDSGSAASSSSQQQTSSSSDDDDDDDDDDEKDGDEDRATQ